MPEEVHQISRKYLKTWFHFTVSVCSVWKLLVKSKSGVTVAKSIGTPSPAFQRQMAIWESHYLWCLCFLLVCGNHGPSIVELCHCFRHYYAIADANLALPGLVSMGHHFEQLLTLPWVVPVTFDCSIPLYVDSVSQSVISNWTSVCRPNFSVLMSPFSFVPNRAWIRFSSFRLFANGRKRMDFSNSLLILKYEPSQQTFLGDSWTTGNCAGDQSSNFCPCSCSPVVVDKVSLIIHLSFMTNKLLEEERSGKATML